MDQQFFRSGVIAAGIAAVIWIVLASAFDAGSRGSVILWAVIFAVVGFVGTVVISTMISRSKK